MSVVQFLYKLSPPYPLAVSIVRGTSFSVFVPCRLAVPRDREPGRKSRTTMYQCA